MDVEAVAVCYLVLVAASSVALVRGLVRARRSRVARPGIDPGSVTDPYDAAFLAGGPSRVVDAAIAALHEDGRLVVAGPGIVAVRRPTARNPVEGALLTEYAAAPSGSLHRLRLGVMGSAAVQSVGDALAARGLMVHPVAVRPWRRRAALYNTLVVAGIPLGVLLATALEPDGGRAGAADAAARSLAPPILLVLPAILLGALIGAACTRAALTRVTAPGRAALRDYRCQDFPHGAARHVALDGIDGVRDPGLRAQLAAAHRLRPGRALPGSRAWAASTAPWGGGCGEAGEEPDAEHSL
ncbi:TIGR04222 domain-containing membrane protein [Actinomycetota bacterium Odt1-20B]